MSNTQSEKKDPYGSYVLSGLKEAQSSESLRTYFMDTPKKHESFTLPTPNPPIADAKPMGNRETFATVQPQINLFGGVSAVRTGQSSGAGLGGDGTASPWPWWGWIIILAIVVAVLTATVARRVYVARKGAVWAHRSHYPPHSFPVGQNEQWA